jgi:hypothetical protein
MSTNIISTLRVLQRLETLLRVGPEGDEYIPFVGAESDEYIPFPGEFPDCVGFSYKIELDHETPENSSRVLLYNANGMKFRISSGMLCKNQSYYGSSDMFRSLGHILETKAWYTGQNPKARFNVIETFSLFLAETQPAVKKCKLVYVDASAFSRIVLEWSLEYECIFNEVHDLSSFIILDAQVES